MILFDKKMMTIITGSAVVLQGVALTGVVVDFLEEVLAVIGNLKLLDNTKKKVRNKNE